MEGGIIFKIIIILRESTRVLSWRVFFLFKSWPVRGRRLFRNEEGADVWIRPRAGGVTSRPACGRSEVPEGRRGMRVEIGRSWRREKGRKGGKERGRSKRSAKEGWKGGWARSERMPRINATTRPGGQNLRIPAGYTGATRDTRSRCTGRWI